MQVSFCNDHDKEDLECFLQEQGSGHISSSKQQVEYLRGICATEEGEILTFPFPSQTNSLLHSMQQSNA